MYNVKQAAEILKVTPRAIQIKCRKLNIQKEGNEFIISNEILNSWKIGRKPQRNEIEVPTNIPKNNFAKTSFMVPFLIAIILIVTCAIYYRMNNEIEAAKLNIINIEAKHEKQIKALDNKLNAAENTIHVQELQIQSLKIKDSLKFFKSW